MQNNKLIENKMFSLGGTGTNPRCKLKVRHTFNSSSVIRLQAMYQEDISDTFISFYEKYGSFSFNNDVGIKGLDKIPIADDKNYVSVDNFYCLEPGYDCSIDGYLSTYPELLKQKLLPICEGEPGDLICIDLTNDKVYYWDHEGEEYKNIYLVAENFIDFILRLEIQEEKQDKKVDKAVFTASSELLEMLKKSGYGPKK